MSMRIVRDSISAWLIVALLIVGGTIGTAQETIYRPKLATPDTLEPFLKLLPPGSDGFETERQATGIEARLGELSDAMRAGRVTSIADSLLAADFRGAPLPAPTSASKGDLPFEVTRMKDAARETTLDARRFSGELRRFVEDSKSVTVAEFQVTSIEPAPTAGLLRTRVRYDIVGAGTTAWRVERVGDLDHDLAPRVVRVARGELGDRRARRESRRAPGVHGGDGRGSRRQRLVRPAVDDRSRHLDDANRLGPDPRLERPSRRLGGRRRRRRPRRPVRGPARRPAQSPLSRARRRDLRGHDRACRTRRPRRHGAVAVRRRRERWRSGSRARHGHAAPALSERREGPVRDRPRGVPLRAAAAGRR